MLALLGAASFGLVAIVVLWPVVEYLWDARGFRKYPVQNFLSGLTGLGYNWEIGRKHSVVRTRPSAAAVKDIYGHKSPLLKNEVYIALQENGRHLGNIISKSYHSDRRQLVASYYAPKNIESWEPKIAALATSLVANMDRLCTSPLHPGQVPAREDLLFDGNRWGLMFAMESASRIGLSANLGFIERGSDAFEIVKPDGSKLTISPIDCLRGYYGAAATLIWDGRLYPILKVLAGAVSPYYARAWVQGDHWRAFLNKLVKERITRYDSGEYLNDLFQPLLEDSKTGGQPDIPIRDKVAEMDQMFNGATDGTGGSLVNTLYYLVKHPDAMQRVRAELDAALSSGSDIVAVPWSKVKNPPYLKACIDEAQRLSPAVAGDLPRKTPPGSTYTVAGVTVPGNTDCSISAYTAQRDPDIFPDPEAFKPERWLIKGEENLKRMLDVYLVFTMGSRMCMGKSVTILVQSVYLATLLHRYEFALASPDWEVQRTERFNLWAGEMPLKIWRRGLQTVADGVSA
ncbi:cytochrome P450 [Diplogelasinospora grovesii]|uniref:Cytochrome P450 n=1 Tax=Diplogelasinospora grovesii TaxID=303347 RepID=A0AAN6S9T9_9PEZI|nr:cytochrome P450 [Diplogelasinospora grovesii]